VGKNPSKQPTNAKKVHIDMELNKLTVNNYSFECNCLYIYSPYVAGDTEMYYVFLLLVLNIP